MIGPTLSGPAACAVDRFHRCEPTLADLCIGGLRHGLDREVRLFVVPELSVVRHLRFHDGHVAATGDWFPAARGVVLALHEPADLSLALTMGRRLAIEAARPTSDRARPTGGAA